MQRNDLIRLQAQCWTPESLLETVGKAPSPTSIDVDGSLSGLVLNCLSKQFIVIDNHNNEKTKQQRVKIPTWILSNVVDCLVNSKNDETNQALIDGTKAMYAHDPVELLFSG